MIYTQRIHNLSCRLSCFVVLGCAHPRTTCLHIYDLYNLWLYFLSSLEALSVHWKWQKQKEQLPVLISGAFPPNKALRVTFQTTMKPHRSMRWYCKYDKIMTFLFSTTISILRFWHYTQTGLGEAEEMLLIHWDMLSFIILYHNLYKNISAQPSQEIVCS